MAVTADDVVKKLMRLFPNGIIYEEQYLKHTGALSFEIYKQSKEFGRVSRQTSIQNHSY